MEEREELLSVATFVSSQSITLLQHTWGLVSACIYINDRLTALGVWENHRRSLELLAALWS
jgi:hypothetical protein